MVRHETEICGAYISSCPGTSNNQKFNFTRINGMEWRKLLCRPRRLAKPLLNGLRFKTSLFQQSAMQMNGCRHIVPLYPYHATNYYGT